MSIQLSSLERLYRYTELSRNDSNEMTLINWMMTVSRMIENYLDRQLLIESRTQYWDTIYDTNEYYVKAYPISSITSVKIDSTGDFDGSETTLTTSDYHKGSYEDSIILNVKLENAKRGLQLVYNGGLASHAVRSVFAIENIVGDPIAPGKWVQGGTSGSWGIVRVIGATSATVEVVQGYFEAGETLTEYPSFGGTAAANTMDIASVTSRALVESYPEIVRACEMQVRYLMKHKDDFETTGTLQNGISVRRSGGVYDLEPEVKAILDTYRRLIYVA